MRGGQGGPVLLVLSRKVGQSLRIGDNVRVKVVEVRGQQVRLGIEAPDDVSITREEISEGNGARRDGESGARDDESPASEEGI